MLKTLWVGVAVAGVVMALLAIMVPIGNARYASRTLKRLSDLDNAPPGFAPSVAEYKAGCTDAMHLWDATGTMMAIGLVGGGAVALLSLLGFGITCGIQKRQTNAQPSLGGDSENRAKDGAVPGAPQG